MTTTSVKLGILASGKGSNLVAIARAIQEGHLQARITVVIYNEPEAQVQEKAAESGIPAVLIHHRDFKKRENFDQKVLETLQSFEVDWVIMAGWMRRATQVLVDGYSERILNIHPSLLPSFRGIRAIEQALDYGVKITGCTVHLVTLGIDEGPIICQAAVTVLSDDTPETLHARIQVEEHRILPEAIKLCISQ